MRLDNYKEHALLWYVFLTFFAFSVLLMFASFIVGERPLHIGTDTHNYYDAYFTITSGHETRLEPFFELFVKFSSLFGGNPSLFFQLHFVTVAMLFVLAGYQLTRLNSDTNMTAMLQIASLTMSAAFLSNWFFVGVANGLRQGLSLAILYFGCALLFRRGRHVMYACIAIPISLLTHYSSVLILPFLMLARLNVGWNICVVLLAAAGYALGLNERAVYLIDKLLPIDLYFNIKFYAEGSDSYVGFNPLFVLYTVFFAILGYCYIRYGGKRNFITSLDTVVSSFKIYCALSVCYFIFGFGAFSNRFGFMAWFFVPVFLSMMLSNFAPIRKHFLLFSPAFMLLSAAYFFLKFGFI